jgi:UDP-N-acetylmuramyl pentapeptide phosphotransferase/UDP-N-acetylglucosamine-1-phosphate transferase
VAGLLVAGALVGLSSPHGERGFIARLLLAAVPAFAGGLIEDLTKRVGVTQRLLLTMAAGALAAWLVGAVLPRLAIPGIDTLLKFYPVAVLFTIVAVAGLANAFNIIDGYNGLASGSALIVLCGLAGLAVKLGDVLVLQAVGATGAAVLGFFVWNWPRGRVFLGDGGAYLLGFLLAELSVLLVLRNPSASPWCALMLMAHPVTETLFSIWRRKIHRGHHPGQPDALHLHQLVYARLVRRDIGSRDPERKLGRNSRVAAYFWVPGVALALLLQFCWDSSRYPVGATAAYFLAYLWLYRRLTHWRAPGWLIDRLSPAVNTLPANR